MRQIILDTETTGLDPKAGHRIIEIGCIELINRSFTGNNFHVYLNPDRQIDDGALAVHGISHKFLQDKPRFADIAKKFLNYIKDAQLVIHNAPFDIGFLNHEYQMLQQNYELMDTYCDISDSLLLARQKHPGQRNSLDALCKRYQIDNSDRDLHGALLDAKLLALVYLAMTGGQSSLFSEEKITFAKQVEPIGTKEVKLQKQYTLKVIKATEKENKLHEAYMEKISE